MGFIGVQELLVILLIILVLFGAKKIPELAKGLGTGLKEFRKAAKDLDKELPNEKVESSSVDDKNSQ
jgi:sec-independent protein translocase protein TatA